DWLPLQEVSCGSLSSVEIQPCLPRTVTCSSTFPSLSAISAPVCRRLDSPATFSSSRMWGPTLPPSAARAGSSPRASFGPSPSNLAPLMLAPVKSAPSISELAQIRPHQEGVALVGPAQVGPCEVCVRQVRLAKLRPEEVGLAEVALAR